MTGQKGSTSPNLLGNLIAVRYREGLEADDCVKAVAAAGIHECDCAKPRLSAGDYSLFPTKPENLEDGMDHEAVLDRLGKDERVKHVSRVFETDNTIVFETDRVVVDSSTSPNGAQLKHFCRNVGLEIREEEGHCCIAELASPGGDPAEQISAIAARAKLMSPEVSVRRDEVTLYRAYEPSEDERKPCYELGESNQAALMEIGAYEAQRMLEGDTRPKIAIIDSGVEATHEDLERSNAKYYDPFSQAHTSDPLDAHGTACAGIALANCNGKGIRGVAPNSDLIGVKFVNKTAKDANGKELWRLDPNAIADAINFAWDEAEADVISLSWGWHLYWGGNLPILNAIDNALKKGRGGLGCVVVAAAGNEGMNFVSWPASMANVLAVGATGKEGTRKAWSEDSPWGSNRGAHLNVVAPGVDIATTDLSDAATDPAEFRGYGPGNYIDGFKGTSAATPMVAGVAALVIAQNPGLTGAQVRKIIEDTADKIGGVEYDEGGHSAEMGYGRVNAAAAVKAAGDGKGPKPSVKRLRPLVSGRARRP